jgi:hypothetical protein
VELLPNKNPSHPNYPNRKAVSIRLPQERPNPTWSPPPPPPTTAGILLTMLFNLNAWQPCMMREPPGQPAPVMMSAACVCPCYCAHTAHTVPTLLTLLTLCHTVPTLLTLCHTVPPLCSHCAHTAHTVPTVPAVSHCAHTVPPLCHTANSAHTAHCAPTVSHCQLCSHCPLCPLCHTVLTLQADAAPSESTNRRTLRCASHTRCTSTCSLPMMTLT